MVVHLFQALLESMSSISQRFNHSLWDEYFKEKDRLCETWTMDSQLESVGMYTF